MPCSFDLSLFSIGDVGSSAYGKKPGQCELALWARERGEGALGGKSQVSEKSHSITQHALA